jgi:hypothetical protein
VTTALRRLALIGSAIALAASSLVSGFAWTGAASGTAAQAVIGAWSDAPPPVPQECSGMEFSQIILGTPGRDRISVDTKRGALVFGFGGDDRIVGGRGPD